MRKTRQLKPATIQRQIVNLETEISWHSPQLRKKLNQIAVLKIGSVKWFELAGDCDVLNSAISCLQFRIKGKEALLAKTLTK